MQKIYQTIADELGAQLSQVKAAVELMDGGATVPFIARYRKEATGGLDDTQLRTLDQRLSYLRELEERRAVILKSIADQGKLTPALQSAVEGADSKTTLEELYLPYRPKRRTKGQIAIEAGLQPLAERLLADPNQDPDALASQYVDINQGVSDTKAALDGARYILMERFAEDAALLAKIRHYLWQEAYISAHVEPGKEKEGAKFADYFEHSELLRKVPSHRALAMLRGRNEGILKLSLTARNGDDEAPCEQMIADHFDLRLSGRAADKWLRQVVQWTWKVKIALYMENELLGRMREQAESEAINVFSRNLRDLLMAAPAGQKTTLGLDPGLRTGVKVAVTSATGKLLETATIYPHAPQNHWDKSLRTLTLLCQKHNIELVAIGNGTASRETDRLVAELIKAGEVKLTKVIVSEAGASVYSASEFAAQEFPELDVSLRGAVSIARRLQDPLAELVKIEPKSIGVGQYQHDVSQSQLAKSLNDVVEDCVNAVGVDINTASVPLLAQVSGLNKTLAQNIVAFRDSTGQISNRKQLLSVPRLGPKAFEQCAGFLRINDGENPLDATTVHPEAYPLVERILAKQGWQIRELMGNKQRLQTLDAAAFVDAQYGLPTILDIFKELEKPGRDPRPEFKTAQFKAGVETLSDLKENMILEGVVTNVTNFGAFIDIGVHQDGLVHISLLSDKFVSDPHQVVKAGDIVKVKVIDVDLPRKRINLSMRLNESAPAKPQHKGASGKTGAKGSPRQPRPAAAPGNAAMGNALAAAFANAKKR